MTATAVKEIEGETEAYRTLLGLAHKRTGAIPEDLLVRHVLEVTQAADWPVQRAALAALLRRLEFAYRDELRVSSRPSAGHPFGIYRTRRPRSPERPYETLLENLDPLRGSCDCADFLRGSLGLCKHLLVVLEGLARQPRRFEKALCTPAMKGGGGRPRLVWDPVRPLVGLGDWLAAVQIDRGNGVREGRRSSLAAARRWFRAGEEGFLVLKDGCVEHPERRLRLVEDLLPLVRRGGGRRGATALEPQPALRALLVSERERLAMIVANRESARHLRTALGTLERKLYPYQVAGVERMLESSRLLLADDMGLGKTAQAIAVCHALWTTGRVRRGLVIVPASPKVQWLREWQLFSGAPVDAVDGSPEERARAYRSQRAGFLIVNYEQVLRDLEIMHDWKPGIVVLDEAQRIKNWATKTAAYVKKLRPPFRMVLTGTPMENRLEELASILDWVDDRALEPKWRLAPWHTVQADGRKGMVGARHLDTLRQRLAPCMLRRVRSEVLRELPSRTDTTVPVELTEAQAEAHEELRLPIAKLLAITRRRPLTQKEFLRLMSLLTTQRIIANGLAQLRFPEIWPEISSIRQPGEALLRSLDSPKLFELREILSQLVVEQERKVVVFSQWRRMLKLADWAVSDLLAQNGLRAAFFTGQEKQRRRTHNLVDFHDDPSVRVLFATDAGGVGLNLQRAASCCVNLELPWNPAVLEQRIGRIYRLGQELPIDVYNLVSHDCIEARIASLISDKRALFTGLFDGSSDEIRFDHSGSFLETVARIIEPVETPDLPEGEEGATEAAEAAERGIDEILEASDESQDVPAASAGERVEMAPAPGFEAVLPAAAQIGHLFSQLRIRPSANGGVSIQAPPEAAAGLAALFEGVAQILKGASPRPEPPRRRSVGERPSPPPLG
ncbi:MAG: DEAD/DEAH box helicase [Myxococcota bacterium]